MNMLIMTKNNRTRKEIGIDLLDKPNDIEISLLVLKVPFSVAYSNLMARKRYRKKVIFFSHTIILTLNHSFINYFSFLILI